MVTWSLVKSSGATLQSIYVRLRNQAGVIARSCALWSVVPGVRTNHTFGGCAGSGEQTAMYPTIHSSSGVGVPTQYSGHSEPESRDHHSATANGPSQLSSSPSNSNALPVLRVHIADHLSISPPVRLSWCSVLTALAIHLHLPVRVSAAGYD